MRRVIAALLRLYPARFRRTLGDDMLATFDEQWRERADWRQATRTVASIASGAALERLHGCQGGDGRMTTLIHDLRFALRMLRRNPGFTAIAVTVLALGIGANSAIFSLVDAVLFKPLPFTDPQRLVMLWERSPGNPRNRVSPLNFVDWSEQNHAFTSMAAISGGGGTLIGPGGIAEHIPGQAVTARFFDVLGVKPIAGRTFTGDDVKPHGDAIVLSERLWRSRFDADPDIVGKAITIDGARLMVIGVVPANFQILFKADFWTPYFIPRSPEYRQMHFMQVIGRLKPGTTLSQAVAGMQVVAEDIARISPSSNKGWGITLAPLREALVGSDLRATSLVLAGIVGFVLLMACANVANLLLVRGSARTREIAVRASVGGSRARIVQQLLTESTLLGVLGGMAGVALAALILSAAPSLLPADTLPVWLRLTMDLRVIGFAAALALITAALFGLAPAWQASRVPLAGALRAGGRTVTGGGSAFRMALAAGEIAAAVLLVAGAGLLLRTLTSLDRVDPGFHADHVLTMGVSLPNSRYPQPENALTFYQSLEREIAAIPGVRDVGLGTILPVEGWDIGQGFQVIGQPKLDQSQQPSAHYQIVSSGYFRTLGIPLLRGRAFTSDDTAANQPVCIVNQEFARQYLRGRDPIGTMVSVQAMAPSGPKPVVRQVVGVSHQVKVEGLAEKEDDPEIYVPITQNPWFWAAIAVRTQGDPLTMVAAVKAAVARIDKQEPLTRIRTMDQVLAESVTEPRFRAALTGAFAMIALALAAVGIFGVLAFSVSQRTREFGIRMALGAQSADVLRMVMGDALKITVAGVAAGLLLAAALTRSLAALLFGVQPHDFATFAGSAALLAVVALIACAAPALRAARVDPAVALHQE
jgi:putative ABC transport system permease protein